MSESFVPRRRGAFVEIAPGTWLRRRAILEVSHQHLTAALAREYGVTPETIRNAAQGRRWRSLDQGAAHGDAE
jgi:hypothetical protein